MRLNDPLVTEIEYEGIEYPVDLSFDNVLDIFDALVDKTKRPYERADIGLTGLLGYNIDLDTGTKVDMWNYIFDKHIKIKIKRPIEYDIKNNPMPIREEEDEGNFIDLDKDAPHIYASFRQAYGINLFEEQGKLHWHEFQSLLNSLPSETAMQRIIQIRRWEPKKGDSPEYIQTMHKLKLIYSLDNEEE